MHGCQKVQLPKANVWQNGSCLASVKSTLLGSLAYSLPYRCFRHCEACGSACHAISINIQALLWRLFSIAQEHRLGNHVLLHRRQFRSPSLLYEMRRWVVVTSWPLPALRRGSGTSNENFGSSSMRGRGKVGKGKVYPQISSLVFIVCQVPFAQAG
jgi:hypothetical protein